MGEIQEDAGWTDSRVNLYADRVWSFDIRAIRGPVEVAIDESCHPFAPFGVSGVIEVASIVAVHAGGAHVSFDHL